MTVYETRPIHLQDRAKCMGTVKAVPVKGDG